MIIPYEEILVKLSNIETLLLNLKIPTQPGSDPIKDELLTINRAAELLSVSIPTVYGYCHTRSIPCMKRRGRLYFSKSELLAWVRSGKRATQDEIRENTLQSLER